MNNKQHIVALEIGSSKIVGAIAEKNDNGVLTLRFLETEKLSNCVRYGCVQNVENVKSAIQRILHNLSKRIDGEITKVYVGMAGRSLHSQVNEVQRSVDSSTPISDVTIKGIIQSARTKPMNKYQILDVVPRAYYVDKRKTDTPVGECGSEIKINVNLIIANEILKRNLYRVLTTSNINVKDYIITPIATGEHLLTPEEKQTGCMLLDFGAETTTVSIYKDGTLAYMNTLPLGGRNLTIDIMNGLNVLEDTAERIKTNIDLPLDPTAANSVIIDGKNSLDAAKYINARFGEIMANVNKQVSYAGMSMDAIRSIVLIGAASQLRGVTDKIKDITKITNVRIGNMPSAINIIDSTCNRIEYIGIMSLLTEAAERIDTVDTCVKINTYDGGMFNVETPEPPTPTSPEPAPTEPKKQKPESWAERMAKKFNRMFAEDPDDE